MINKQNKVYEKGKRICYNELLNIKFLFDNGENITSISKKIGRTYNCIKKYINLNFNFKIKRGKYSIIQDKRIIDYI
jgi:hypothetical protein